MLPNNLQGPSLLLHKSFLILGNAARCAPLEIPQNASEDDIQVLFFHVVLSTGQTLAGNTDIPQSRQVNYSKRHIPKLCCIFLIKYFKNCAFFCFSTFFTIQYSKLLLDLIHSFFLLWLMSESLKMGLCPSSLILINRSFPPEIKVRSRAMSKWAIWKSNMPALVKKTDGCWYYVP